MAVMIGLWSAGCSMEPEAGEVRVEIQEKLSDTKKDRYERKLKALAGSGMTKSQTINGHATWVLSGVDDVKAFADKIEFAKVVSVDEAKRTVVLSVN